MFEEKIKEEIKPVPSVLNEPVFTSRLSEDLIEEVIKSGPAKGKIITFIIIGLIILGGLTLGGYFLYQRFFSQKVLVTDNINQNINSLTGLSLNDQMICYLKNNPNMLNFFAQGKVRNAYQEKAVQANNCPTETNDHSAELYSLISQDKDGDGLNAFVESRIGTEEINSDTDGDSHSDLTEINNGYNPAGAGKLEGLAW